VDRDDTDEALWADELDEESWNRASEFWRGEVDRLALESGQADEWRSWEPTTWGDAVTSEPWYFRSTCEGRSYALDRSFQIHEHREGWGEISAHIKDFEHDELWIESEWPRLPKAILVINLEMSDRAAEAVRVLLRRWMDPGTTVQEMVELIDAV
jgi:hypothetical protein